MYFMWFFTLLLVTGTPIVNSTSVVVTPTSVCKCTWSMPEDLLSLCLNVVGSTEVQLDSLYYIHGVDFTHNSQVPGLNISYYHPMNSSWSSFYHSKTEVCFIFIWNIVLFLKNLLKLVLYVHYAILLWDWISCQ